MCPEGESNLQLTYSGHKTQGAQYKTDAQAFL